jgi:beta-lactamase superfamily II metal-dependent hydrolase
MTRLLITTIVLFASVMSPYAQIPEDNLQVHFIDVGTGNCIWIHTGDDAIAGNGRMEGYNISFLFTGDAEHFIENELVNTLGNGLPSTALKAGHHGSTSSTSDAFLRAVRPAHVVICAGNQSFSGTMLPRQETLTLIQAVSNDLGLNTDLWRTDRGDKTPTPIPIGSETGDDTILATTGGQTLNIRYVDAVTGDTGADPSRCRAITQSGTECI